MLEDKVTHNLQLTWHVISVQDSRKSLQRVQSVATLSWVHDSIKKNFTFRNLALTVCYIALLIQLIKLIKLL